MLITQLKYDLIMFSRELFYLIFSLIVPPVSYVFMGQLFGDETYMNGLSYAQMYTPSFIILITFAVVFFAFGFDQVMNRAMGVEKRINVSPVSKKTILMAGIMKSVIITSFGYVLINVMGIALYDIPFQPKVILGAYVFFILLNALLLVISFAVYSLFKDMKSVLIFSILIFQYVMFTGDFSLPVDNMPTFIQIMAEINPVYHMNHLFIDIWNEQLVLSSNETLISIGVILVSFIAALFVLRFKRKEA